MAQITNSGSLWDASHRLYNDFPGAYSVKTPRPNWKFPSGANVMFAHLENESNKYDYQGAEICLIEFDELTHFCLTPETEVLTENGWKNIKDVQIGEMVPSLSFEGEIQMKKVLNTPSFDYDGELINISQRNGISARMTPNHKVPVLWQGNDKSKKYTFTEAENFTKRSKMVLRNGDWKDGIEKEYKYFTLPKGRGIGNNANITDKVRMDDWLEFLGWYLSEGSSFLAAKTKGGTSPCISIRQTKPCDTLDSLMKRLPWRSCKDGDGGYKIFSRQLYDELHPMGNLYQKRIPREIFLLTKRQQKILFDAFVNGDGYVAKNGRIQIGLANNGLIDDLHEMVVYLGYSATKTEMTTKTGFKVYELYISDKRTLTHVKPEHVKKEKYKGKVYCLTVEDNHTFMIRHNNRTHWTGNSESQFFYMVSRNRSTCGIKPYIRATCNPDPDSFVAKLISWWWDPKTGYPIKERSGKIRYFARVDEVIMWGDTREEVLELPGVREAYEATKAKFNEMGLEYSLDMFILSFTFIASSIYDNKELLRLNPMYLTNLQSLSLVERERLLKGNWLIRPAAGLMFKRVQANMVDTIPSDVIRWVRAWDMAATEKDENGEAAYTAGVLIGKRKCGRWIIGDVINQQLSADKVRKIIKDTASIDKAKYKKYKVRLNQDPGQAGKEQAQSYMKMLAGFSVSIERESGDKVTRAEPLSAQWQAGNVDVLIAEWNDIYFNQLESFPDGKWKDMVDASGTAFAELEKSNTAAPPPEDVGNTKTSYWSS